MYLRISLLWSVLIFRVIGTVRVCRGGGAGWKWGIGGRETDCLRRTGKEEGQRNREP